MKKPLVKKLPSGLTLMLAPQPSLTTATVLVLVRNGSDYETRRENGISHFIEHLTFKGSAHFPTPIVLATELDSIGADYNAYTAHEYTGYYIKTFPEYLDRAIEIIADLYARPLFPAEEVEKERKVILEEINYYDDSPRELVSDLMSQVLYGDQPAGRPILGTKQTLRAMTRTKIANYYRQHYSARNTLVVVAGNCNAAATRRLVTKHFAGLPRHAAPEKRLTRIPAPQFRQLVKVKDVRQAHLAVGFETGGLRALNEERFPLGLLASVLGYGFSSRMFRVLRDELSVTYYVNVGTNLCTDRGSLTIHTGSDVTRVEEVLAVIVRELKRIRQTRVGRAELEKAKAVLEHNLLMSTETSDSLGWYWGSAFLTERSLLTPAEVINRVTRLTAADVQRHARKHFTAAKANLAIIVPKRLKHNPRRAFAALG